MTERKTELLRKIKALADRGERGEKEAAQAILARMMKQYGIDEAELEEDRKETAWFAYKQDTDRRLLQQIIYMVTGEMPFGCVGTYTGRKRKKVGVECTAAERLEIEANFAFFKEAMKAELEIFYSAFIQKNNLYPQNVEVRYIEDMTPEERERALKASMMANGMERHTLLKQITEGGGGYD